MAFTQADIDRIDDAIRNARLSVRDETGATVTYRNMDELLKARALAVREVNLASTAANPAARGAAIAVWK